jgi:hypothetical protein
LALIRGLSIPITKFAQETLPPMTLTAQRIGIAVPALFLDAAAKKQSPSVSCARVSAT